MTPAPATTPSHSNELFLEIRIPSERLFHGVVQSIRAEDLDGWFGLRAGHPDILAVLPAGLLLFEDEQGAAFVATSGGVLNLLNGRCRLALRSAVLTRDSDVLATHLTESREQEHQRKVRQDAVLETLLDEAVRRATENATRTEWRNTP